MIAKSHSRERSSGRLPLLTTCFVAFYAFSFLAFTAFGDAWRQFFPSARQPDNFARYVLPICVALPQWLSLRSGLKRRSPPLPEDDFA